MFFATKSFDTQFEIKKSTTWLHLTQPTLLF